LRFDAKLYTQGTAKEHAALLSLKKKALQKKIMYIDTSLGTPVTLPDE